MDRDEYTGWYIWGKSLSEWGVTEDAGLVNMRLGYDLPNITMKTLTYYSFTELIISY